MPKMTVAVALIPLVPGSTGTGPVAAANALTECPARHVLDADDGAAPDGRAGRQILGPFPCVLDRALACLPPRRPQAPPRP